MIRVMRIKKQNNVLKGVKMPHIAAVGDNILRVFLYKGHFLCLKLNILNATVINSAFVLFLCLYSTVQHKRKLHLPKSKQPQLQYVASENTKT